MGDNASRSTTIPPGSQLASQYLLWVDGAGVFLLCLDDQVTIGGLREDANRADICLMSNLSRKHATVIRSHGGYRIQSHGRLKVENQELALNEFFPLKQTAEWVLDEGVKIQFRQPHVLSLTGILDFRSSHRPLVGQPPVTVDRVILMDQNCLLGPGGGQHIPLNDSEEGVILFRSKGELWCKSKTAFLPNNGPPTSTHALTSGDVIAGDDFRFRIEAVPRPET